VHVLKKIPVVVEELADECELEVQETTPSDPTKQGCESPELEFRMMIHPRQVFTARMMNDKYVDDLSELPRAISFSCELRFGKHKRTQCAPAADGQHTHRRRLAASTSREHVAVREIKTKNCREWAAEKRNPTSEAHYDGTFPTTSRTTTNDNGIRQLTAEIWDQGKTRTDADLLRARQRELWSIIIMDKENAKGKREGGENTPNALCVGTRHANTST
jgi:hypothetical protein